MAEINWGLAQMPDIGGNALAAFEHGRAQAKQERSQNALLRIMRPKTPGQTPGIGDGVAQQRQADPWGQLTREDMGAAMQYQQGQDQLAYKRQQDDTAKRIDMIGQAALAADTPEKWDSAVGYLSQFYPEVAQYKGQFSPGLREAAIAAAGQMKTHLEQGQGYTLAPGSRRFDATGKLIAEAPFAPHYSTVGEGQTVVRDQPATSGPLSVQSLLPAIVAQESGGNYSAVNSDSGALGAYQVMPATAQTLAGRLGMPWRPDLMTAATPEGKQYQDAIGQAAVQEAVQASGGDPTQAAMYYHGGSDRSKWGPKTQKYGQEVVARLGSGATVVAQGAPKAEKPKDAPAGYRWKADGSMEPIPGGPADKSPKTEQGYSQSAIDAFNRAIDTGNRLLQHQGFSSAVGMKGLTGGLLGGWVVPGTDAADFKGELNAMKAQVFLPMVQSMKGMGALSNAEGEKLTAAIGALDTNMSENAFKASLQRIIRNLTSYRDRGGAAPKQNAATPRPAASRQPAGEPAARPSVSNW